MTADEFNATLKTLGLSQAQFARFIGLTKAAVANWCKDRRAVPPYVVCILMLLTELGPAARSAVIDRYAKPRARAGQS